MWKKLNQIVKGRCGKMAIQSLHTGGERLTDMEATVNAFGVHFAESNGMSINTPSDISEELVIPTNTESFTFGKVESADVLDVINSRDTRKTAGLHSISARGLKYCGPAICDSLSDLFNYSLSQGAIPKEWKSARIAPVPKSSSNDIDQFCPVSILPVVSKVLEILIKRQLSLFLQSSNVLCKNQAGFRPNHTTQDVLLASVDKWRMALDQNL
jgi:hypothetical protein